MNAVRDRRRHGVTPETSTRAGSRVNSFESRTTASDRVAENSSVCRDCRQGGQHAAKRRQKAHVEHPVGFIEREHLDLRQVDRAALQMIDESPRRGDDDVRALSERLICVDIDTPPNTAVTRSCTGAPYVASAR